MSMYAVVAPGLSCIYSNWVEVERVKALYPYPKWAKFESEVEAAAWLKRNTYGHGLRTINAYGDILPNLHVKAQYQMFDDCLCIVYDMSRVGDMRLRHSKALIEYHGRYVKVKLPDTYLSDESISSHMVAIYNTLWTLGDYLDIDIYIPHYAVYYCLTSYKGSQRSIQTVKNLIQQRSGNVAFTMNFKED